MAESQGGQQHSAVLSFTRTIEFTPISLSSYEHRTRDESPEYVSGIVVVVIPLVTGVTTFVVESGTDSSS